MNETKERPNLAGGARVHARLRSGARLCGPTSGKDVPTDAPVDCSRCLKSLAVSARTTRSGHKEGQT